MDLVEEDILMHYGVKRRSGRYPWGSGDNPYQHGGDFLARVEELQRLGKTEKQIADELHLSTTDLRMQVRVAKHERRALQADRARSLREDGKTLDEIASILGYANDSSVRALLNENTAANKNKAQATAEILKKELAEKGAIDVGTGVERQLGVSTGVLQEALFILETEGYNRYGVGVPQVNDPKKRTITPVISVPEIDQREVYQNLDLVKSVGDYHSTDGGESWDKREYPASIDSSRVKILYGDEGGALKDGVIEIRRGVADLDLGDSHYAQVRILVDGTHYLKGMAMYSDDMPDGADIVFNTNKHTGTPKMDVLKKIQDDPDNPFGALIKANGQSHYIDADGNDLTKKPTPPSKLESTKKAVDATSELVNRAKKMDQDIRNATKKERMDLSKKTDKELRDQINRELLERQYNDLFAKESVSKGRRYLSDVLDNAGTVLAVGSSALSIALAIQQLQKKAG